MATYRTILTNKGIQLVAEAATSGSQIQLTDMGVGDGNGNPVTPNPAQTSLARERYRAELNTLIVDPTNANRFIAELVIPASVGGFVMREVGLYTADGDLFAVANVPDTYKPTTAEGAFSDTVIRMVFAVANASVVTIVLDPNVAIATRTWVLNNVNAGTMIPGGLTDQALFKKSNADGDVEWRDPTAGITVIVFSREETQTLAASQTVIDLAEITAEGSAVYIEGVRLRSDEFTQTGPAQITLDVSHPAGTKVTVVQNEEVGTTDVLLRPNNLSDVPDKAQARANLGIPNYVATVNIDWGQLQNVPAYASRWSSWAEVTDKPTTFPPSAHSHAWVDISGAPDTATRWPQWTEVTNKPSLFPPSAHSHSEYVQKAGDTMTGQLLLTGGLTNSGMAITTSSSAMEVKGNGTGSAHITLHRPGAFGCFFGLDTDNALKVGGYSFGNAAHRIVHEGLGAVALPGTISAAGGFDFGSSRKLKDIDGAMPYGLAEVERIATLIGRYKPEYNPDGRRRVFFDAEQLADIIPEAVDPEGVEFQGERVPSVKLDQVLPVLSNAIAELAAMVRRQAEEIAELKAGR